ncbi:MAG: hypothetical protein K8R85_11730, partial [Bacteroidetes bacterium]|nr:hypothetical protein [Bacteroidota bacterium]
GKIYNDGIGGIKGLTIGRGFQSGFPNFSFGSLAIATGSTAIGYNVMTTNTAIKSIVLGSGFGTSSSLINTKSNTLMVGFNSTVPTLFVDASPGPGNATTGNVGIGTANPYKKLTVNGDISLANYNTSGGGSPGDGFSGIEILGMGQVPTRRGISIDPDPNGSFNFYIHTFQNSSAFNFKNGNGNTTLMTINGNGNVGIGTDLASNTNNYKLAVNGGIRAKSLKVEPNWADYVFEKNYSLSTIEELEHYIKKYGHLPEIPTAEEIKSNGADVGELLKLQMQKIEELTLYVIQLQKEINEIKKK